MRLREGVCGGGDFGHRWLSASIWGTTAGAQCYCVCVSLGAFFIPVCTLYCCVSFYLSKINYDDDDEEEDQEGSLVWIARIYSGNDLWKANIPVGIVRFKLESTAEWYQCGENKDDELTWGKQAVRVATQYAPARILPRGRPSASRAAKQTQRSSTFSRRIRSHADHCSRLMR